MRVLQLFPRFEECEKPAHAEQHDSDDKRVDVPFAAIPEGMLLAGRLAGTLASDQEKQLIARISNGGFTTSQGTETSRKMARHRSRLRPEHRTFSGAGHAHLTWNKPADKEPAVC